MRYATVNAGAPARFCHPRSLGIHRLTHAPTHENGTEGQPVQYEVAGDAVVSTIPLGVLKAVRLPIFSRMNSPRYSSAHATPFPASACPL